MIMKGPSDQAKLLFFGLLRTVSALATSEPKIVPYAAASAAAAAAATAGTTNALSANPRITLRLARRTDVPSIQRCNLATLPENYNQQFYTNHLRQWPELALVAERIDVSDDGEGRGGRQQSHQLSYSPFPLASSASDNGGGGGDIVAYVIGKVEERVLSPDEALLAGIHDDDDYNNNNGDGDNAGGTSSPSPRRRSLLYPTERLGHVTSLAVLEPYRGKGLAMDLMKQLHHHLAACYGVDVVGLHVRQSNAAAGGLYRRFGYEAVERIPAYYQDGEDAYFMKKRIDVEQHRRYLQQQGNGSGAGGMGGGGAAGLFRNLRRSRPWESGPDDLRLPRQVGGTDSSQDSSQEDGTPELLTGTM